MEEWKYQSIEEHRVGGREIWGMVYAGMTANVEGLCVGQEGVLPVITNFTHTHIHTHTHTHTHTAHLIHTRDL